MAKRRVFWGLYADPSRWMIFGLGVFPFLVLIGTYLFASHLRLEENAQDKLLPSPVQMFQAFKMMAFSEDKRSGDYLMVADTLASLSRLGIGVFFAALSGLLVGIVTGLYRGFGFLFTPFLTFVSIIPPLAVLPILFITFGVDEFAKIMLIFLGTFPLITRDIYSSVRSTPVELITKSLTLGASDFEVAFRIVLPQMMPRLIDTVRLSLGGAWLFLIASEAIASTNGLGYRIFLVRRYLAMDVIIPYVLWITFLGFGFDWLLQKIISKRYHWYQR